MSDQDLKPETPGTNAETDASAKRGRGQLYLKVSEKGVAIVHEEHGTVNLAPNTTYKIHRAREYDYLRGLAERVRD